MEGVGGRETNGPSAPLPHQELVRVEPAYVAGIWKPRRDLLCTQKALLLSRRLRPLAPLWSTVALSH